MTKLAWDIDGTRRFEMGTDRGVLYKKKSDGTYDVGVAWNGLTAVTESPSGAEKTDLYADNMKYASLLSAEDFGATVEAYTYPDEFAECDGSVEIAPGVYAGQQARVGFGLSYRTMIGTDANANAGYKIHIVYGCLASPSEKSFATVNDSPEAATLSWEITTTPVQSASLMKPTAVLTINSLDTSADKIAALEAILYGTDAKAGEATEPRLPSVDEVAELMKVTNPAA